jgi:putative DNA primase/helicase
MFSQYAQKYWAKGLPAMPLRPNAKVPALNSWQAYCATMPTKEEQARWLESYPDGNIGLPLGPQSGVVALDLDSVDPRVERVLEQIMPHSPWKRVGKKGAVYAFKYNGERTYRIKDENNNTVMEVLSRGAQIVLPPSIHPDTMKPYVSNTELVDVVDKLVPLPSNFEVLIRTALIDAGVKLSSRGSNKVTEWVPSGGRDSAMTAIAGLQARAVSRGERSLLEAMSEMEAWIATYTEKVVGDTLTPEKGRAKVMEFVRRDIADHQRALPSGWDAGMTVEERAECKKYFGDDFEDLNRSQVFDMLTQKFMETPKEDTEGRMAIIDETMLRLAKSAVLTSTDHDMIIQFIQNANGRIVSTGALRKRIKELRGGEHLGEDHTEIALLLIKELERYGEIRYQGTDFYQWRGAHWQRMSTPEIMKVLAENFGSMPAARKHSDHKGILQTMVSLVPNELQTLRMDGINFANGYLTLDLELIDHDPRYGATYCMPYRYAPGEGAPMRFLAFFGPVLG